MYGTLNNMMAIVDKEDLQLEINDLVLLYQDGLNPRYLAAAYKKVYPIISNISNYATYYQITEDEKGSLTLNVLNEAMQRYVIGGEASFNTYYGRALKFEYNKLVSYYKAEKRVAITEHNSIEYMYEDHGFEASCHDHEVGFENLCELITTAGLTEDEHVVMWGMFEGYTYEELAKRIGVSIATITNMRKRIKLKVGEVM